MICYSLWKGNFLKADRDHLASTCQQGRRTQAEGALGVGLQGKAKRKNKKKRQEGNDRGNDGEEGGAEDGDQRPQRPSKPRCGFCKTAPGQAPKQPQWTDRCLLLGANQKQKLQAGNNCLGC